jgi:hypothetical protein
VERKPYLSQGPTGKIPAGSDMEIAQARQWTPLGRCIAQAIAYSRILSPYCGCVVAFCHVGKQHTVCLEVAGALTTTTYHDMSRHLKSLLYCSGKS